MAEDDGGVQRTLGAYGDGSPADASAADESAAGAGEGSSPGEAEATDGVYEVAVKDSARAANDAVAEWVEAAGATFTYGSRSTAEEHADALSAQGGARVAVQAAAPADDSTADAYLVADEERDVAAPADPAADALAFDVSGNQYGALGEALVTTPATNPPALTHYVERDLDLEGAVRVRVEDAEPVTAVSVADAATRLTERTWLPDCVAVAERRPSGAVVGRYWCEIKTGDGSFERNQTAVMRAKAAEPGATVLTVRVSLDDLPDGYAVRFSRVRPDGDRADGDESTDEPVARASEDAEIL